MNNKVKNYIADFLGLLGTVMLAYGLWLLKPLVMFIVIGVLFITSAILLSGGIKRNSKPRG